jgi:hypothetical protein
MDRAEVELSLVPAIYRGWQHGNQTPVLAAAIDPEQPSPQGVRLLKRGYSLAMEPLSNLMTPGHVHRADRIRVTDGEGSRILKSMREAEALKA